MEKRHERRVGIRTALLTLIAAASLIGITLASVRGPMAGTSDAQWPLSWLAWPVAGWMVLMRRPGNRIGQTMQPGAVARWMGHQAPARDHQ